MNVVSLPSIIICTSLFNLKSLDIEMGTFSILNINNQIRYFTNVPNGKIPVSLYIFFRRGQEMRICNNPDNFIL